VTPGSHVNQAAGAAGYRRRAPASLIPAPLKRGTLKAELALRTHYRYYARRFIIICRVSERYAATFTRGRAISFESEFLMAALKR